MEKPQKKTLLLRMADAGNPGGSVPENVKMSVTLHWHPLLHGKNHLVRE